MSNIWLPFTQMREYESRAHTFVRGERAWLWDADGKRLYDAISSVWTTIHGHCHPHIVQAIRGKPRFSITQLCSAVRIRSPNSLPKSSPILPRWTVRSSRPMGPVPLKCDQDGAPVLAERR